MFFMRSTLLIIIIITTSPLVLFAKMGSSEAGLFYSTSWGSGVMGGYSYTNEILLGGDFAAGDSSTTSSGAGTSIKSESTFMTVNAF